MLSGVVILDLKGTGPQWRHETCLINPDVSHPIDYAISHHHVPTPSQAHQSRFQVEQWVPHAAPSAIFDKEHSVNAGFAVDLWRPHHFATDTDVVTNAPFGNIFTGIEVDLAVSDIDAIFYRVSYHITLLGRIRYGQPIIID